MSKPDDCTPRIGARGALAGQRCSVVVVVPPQGRRSGLVVVDLETTLESYVCRFDTWAHGVRRLPENCEVEHWAMKPPQGSAWRNARGVVLTVTRNACDVETGRHWVIGWAATQGWVATPAADWSAHWLPHRNH